MDPSSINPDDPANRYQYTTDHQALKDIGRRTSTAGRIGFALIAIAVVGGGIWFALGSKKSEEHEAQLEEINKLEDKSQVAPKLRAMLPEVSNADLRMRILMNLGYLKDVESVPFMTAALDEGPIVRGAAADALAMVGSPGADSAKPKLLEVLPKTEQVDRPSVVWALAKLKEPQASAAIIEEFSAGRLQKKEGFSPKVIADVLGIGRLSSDELINHESEAVRVLTAQALGEAASPEVVAPLGKLLQAEINRKPDQRSTEVIRAASAGLGRSGDARAAAPLFALMQAEKSMRGAVIEGLRRSTAAPGIANLLKQAKDTEIQRELVKLLAESRDPRIADTLANYLQSEDEETRLAAARGLAELGDSRAAPTLLEQAKSEDKKVGNDALDALRYVATPQIVAPLIELAKEKPGRKAAILRAIGKSGDMGASGFLESELQGDDVGAAALALADLGSKSGFTKLEKMLPRPKDTDMSEPSVVNEMLMLNRKAAIAAMGRFGDASVVPALMKIVEDPQDDPRLRALAAESIGSIGDESHIAEVIARIKSADANDDAKSFYVQALWQRPRPSFAADMVSILRTAESPAVKKATAIAIGYSGGPGTSKELMAMLDDESLRRYAGFAIMLSGEPDAVAKLMTVLEKDKDMAEVLQMAFSQEDDDTFNILTKGMFDSGQIWRRAQAAKQLRDGDGTQSYSYAWNRVVNALSAGWTGAEGVPKHEVREIMWKELHSENPVRRQLVIALLYGMSERGLLLRARNEGGAVGEAAREALVASARL